MAEVRENGDNLVQVTEGGQEWTDVWRVSESMEKFQLVGDTMRRRRYVNLFESNVLGSALCSGRNLFGI